MTDLAYKAVNWPAAPLEPILGEEEIHIWAAPLDPTPVILGTLSTWLSAPERERASRFRFEHHRNRLIAGRGLLRAILSRYLGRKPAALEFAYGPIGKPSLGGGLAGSNLQFNLSHSENLALLAITRAGPIGVDVERVRHLEDADELVSRFFSPGESASYRSLAEDQKPGAFFNLWTRKEALLKATGEGIAHSLHLVEVSFLPGAPARLLSLPLHLAQGRNWSIYDVTPAPEFVGCVAIGAKINQLQCWRWDDRLLDH